MEVIFQETASGATAAAFQVEFVQGSIENQQVDALVSPMVANDPLSTAIGNTLSNMTGNKLRMKFNKERAICLLSGIVVVEGLLGLKCKAVIFLNLLCWDNDPHGTAVQVLRQGITSILNECCIRRYRSVAIPLLGTGVVLRFPQDVASTILQEEVCVYGQTWASRTPFLVQIIVQPTAKASIQGSHSVQRAKDQGGFTSNVDSAEDSFYQCVSVTNEEITVLMGGVILQVQLGDIINAGTDVIVNTTDFNNYESGVSKAILTAAGPTIFAELIKVGIPAKLICTTPGGQLGCKEIIHARFMCSPQRIRRTCRKILKQCERRGYGSVTFPAINTGQAGMRSVKACNAMLDGLESAVEDMKPFSLSLIRIIMLKRQIFNIFRSELESRCMEEQLKQLSLSGCVASSTLALELPPHWEPLIGEDFKKVELDPNSAEFQEVANGFHKTAFNNIHKIERVQNVYLWHAFSICRYRILSKNGEAELGEKLLYHGTSAASCKSIERDRFDRSYAGQHAAAYGKGVYFAVNASVSAAKYSPADGSGLKRLYVARVLTGRYTVGQSSMKAPPPRGGDPTDCFDSLVDNLQHPMIFVIFHDDQAYPEYLITFS